MEPPANGPDERHREAACSAPGVSVCTHVSDVLELTDALTQRAGLN